MTGAALHVDDRDLRRLTARLQRFADANRADLLDAVGAETVSQTQRRLAEERTGPDGDAWPAWSTPYARRRGSQHSLLVGENELLDSIAHLVAGKDVVEVGSPLIYAAIQHFGGRGIPPRPYLGWSDENEADIGHVIDDWLDRALAV